MPGAASPSSPARSRSGEPDRPLDREIARSTGAIQQATQQAVRAVGEMVERVASLERITHSVASPTEQQTTATGNIARNVAEAAGAIRAVADQIEAVSTEARSTDAAVGEMRTLAGDVGKRIDELRTVMVRIVRTSSDEADRRSDTRAALMRRRPWWWTARTCRRPASI